MILSPKGLHLIKHDLVTGIITRGKATAVPGHVMKVSGSRGTNCWGDALDDILEKLCEHGGCSVIDERPFRELGFQEILNERVSPGQAAVAGLPMSSMSREKRGKRIQEIGLAIDRSLYPQSLFFVFFVFFFFSSLCGKSNASADSVRGSVRVELKGSGLKFNRSKDVWQCQFCCIKTGLFDELWLAIYSCKGIYFYTVKSLEHLQLSRQAQLQNTTATPRFSVDRATSSIHWKR